MATFLDYEEELVLSDHLHDRRTLSEEIDAFGDPLAMPRDEARTRLAQLQDRARALVETADGLKTAELKALTTALGRSDEEERGKPQERLRELQDVLLEVVTERGRRAASRLVEGYIPFIGSLAHGAIMRRPTFGSNGTVSMDDLVQVGCLEALTRSWTFDARGKSRTDPDAYSGRRFNTYMKLPVLKAMNRHIAKMSSPYTANLDKVQETWKWMGAKRDLADKLGRNPTEAEIERETGIYPGMVEDGLPNSAAVGDVDDVDVHMTYDLEESFQQDADTAMYNGLVREMLEEMFRDDLVDVFMLTLGADKGVPRTAREVAKILNLTRALAAEREQMIFGAIRHPQYRAEMLRFLRSRLPEDG